jgi:sulfite reductase beta subunit-like hemoprotein
VQLWLGGSPNQTRLAKVFMERMKVRDLEATLEPLFAAYKARRTTKVGVRGRQQLCVSLGGLRAGSWQCLGERSSSCTSY